MTREELKEKLRLQKKKKAKNDAMLKVFLSIFFIGYIFFFSSLYTLPKVYRNIKVCEAGDVINLEDYVLTFCTWDWSEEEKSFELIFDFKNLTLNDEPEYNFVFKEGDTLYPGKVLEKGDKLIVKAEDINKRWSEITLNITIGNKSNHINMNDKKVNRVRYLKNRSQKEYDIYALKRKITGMEEKVESLEKEKVSLNNTIEKAYIKLEEFNTSKKTHTKEEREQNAAYKAKVSAEVEDLIGNLNELMDSIDEYNQKIKLQKSMLSALKNS